MRGAQMADPEMTSVLALFRRAANVLARLEDAVVFRGLVPDPAHHSLAGSRCSAQIWDIMAASRRLGNQGGAAPGRGSGRAIPQRLTVASFSGRRHDAEAGAWWQRYPRPLAFWRRSGHFGPFAVVLDQGCFLSRRPPTETVMYCRKTASSRSWAAVRCSVRPRLTTLHGHSGVVVALGGAPVELVVATDMSLQFLQVTAEPNFLFRVREKIALRIKEPERSYSFICR